MRMFTPVKTTWAIHEGQISTEIDDEESQAGAEGGGQQIFDICKLFPFA